MRPVSVTIAFLIGNALSMLGQFILIDAVLQRRCRTGPAARIIYYCVAYVVSSAIYLFLPIDVLFNIIFATLTFFLFTLFYYAKWPVRLLASIFSQMLAVPAEALAALIVCHLFGVTFDQLDNDPQLVPWGIMLAHILVLLLTFAFAMVIRAKAVSGSRLPNQYLAILIVIPLLSISICYILAEDYMQRLSSGGIFVFAGALLLLAINILILLLYRKLLRETAEQYKNRLLEQQRCAYANQLELEQQSGQSIRNLRCDLKQQAVVLQDLILRDDMGAAEQYVNKFMEKLDHTGRYAASGFAPLDSILNYKLMIAEQVGASTDVTLHVPRSLPIEPFDLSVLFGNLLDNAIDAIQASGHKGIWVNVRLDRNILYLCVKNDYAGVRRKAENGLYLSAKPEAARRGAGLTGVRDVVRKYGGDLQISDKDQQFSVTAMLYMDEPVG